MRKPCGAVFFSAAVSWGAAAPAAAAQSGPDALGPFEIQLEADIDLAAALADERGVEPGPHVDARVRMDAEAVTAEGLRWGLTVHGAARTVDGRRGLQSRGAAELGPVGLVTGLGGDGAPEEVLIGAERLEAFIKTALFEAYAGHGPTAAQRERIHPVQALRLHAADGGRLDPLGDSLVDTGLTLSEPAAQVTARTRRLAGFALAVSYTPQGDVCGVDRCRNAAYGGIDQVVSAAVSFDRRAPASRARWRGVASFEAGQASLGPLSTSLDDPWIASVQVERESGAVSAGFNATHAQDGAQGRSYAAWSAHASIERGDWLFDAQIGNGRSDVIDRSGWAAQLGASRFVGSRGLAGGAVQIQDGRGVALIAEAGLRF